MAFLPRNIVECLGSDPLGSRCGYCGRARSSVSYGAWAHRLGVTEYQDLLDAGWRRSGNYLYRPDLSITCCPAYVIRLDVNKFRPSRGQKRVLKKLRRFGTESRDPVSSSANRQTCSSGSRRDLEPTERHIDVRKERIHSAVVQAVEQLSKRHDFVSADILRTVGNDLHVMVPKAASISAKKKRKIEKRKRVSGDAQTRLQSTLPSAVDESRLEQVVPSAPAYASNAALVLAAGERRTQVGRQTALQHENKDLVLTDFGSNGHGSSQGSAGLGTASSAVRLKKPTEKKSLMHASRQLAHVGTLTREMELAEMISGQLRVTADSVDICHLEVAQPGFINIWLRSSSDLDTGQGQQQLRQPSQGVMSDMVEFPVQPMSSLSSPTFPRADHSCTENGNMRQVFNSRQGGAERIVVDNVDMKASAVVAGRESLYAIVENGETFRNVEAGSSLEHGTERDESDGEVSEADSEDSEDEPASARDSTVRLAAPVVLHHLSEDEAFTMEIVPAQFEVESYKIYRKYQMSIHGESENQCREDAYRRFLVDSPLIREHAPEYPEYGCGSFHMLYKFNGTLFAVGVVDVLPRCLSSVYLFYDPAFSSLSPGVLAALKEIEWVRDVVTRCPAIRFYYMGYYIHTCPKMRYKAGYKPSELLCETTRNWIPAADAAAILDERGPEGHVLRFAPEDMAVPDAAREHRLSDEDTSSEVERALMLLDRDVLPFKIVEQMLSDRHAQRMVAVRALLGQFVRLVGRSRSRQYQHVL